MQSNCTSPQERFRTIFQSLDSQGVWAQHLSPSALSHARTCSTDAFLWSKFLSGRPSTPTDDLNASSRDRMMDVVPNESPQVRAKSPATPRGLKRASPTSSPALLVPAESPRRRKENPWRTMRKEAIPAEGLEAVSAAVRRRLAVASVDEQFLHSIRGTTQDDGLYEDDEGMMPGDDGGYTSYTELEEEEKTSSRAQTGVYTLLGCNEGGGNDSLDSLTADGNGGAEEKERFPRPATSPKRPRKTPRLGLSEQMETFIRELRELCEPHRDAAKEESAVSKGVPKNIHRKAVSAASVVEELKEMEYKARIDKFERVEDCISAVSACIGNQDETFAEVLTQISDRAEKLREECRKRKQRYEAISLAKAMTTGVLGADITQIVTMDLDRDRESLGPAPAVEQEAQNERDRNSSNPFSDRDLQCWPRNDECNLPVSCPSRPRVPLFQDFRSSDASRTTDAEGPQHEESLVSLIGLDNPVMKNVLGMINLRRRRENAFSKFASWSKQKTEGLAKATTQTDTIANEKNRDSKAGTTAEAQGDAATLTNRNRPSTHDGGKLAKGPSQTKGSNGGHNAMSELLEIKTDPLSDASSQRRFVGLQESRERALGKASCALMCYHGGFTHASSFALDILTDVVESFVVRIGHSLTSCRENIDREGVDVQEGSQRIKSKDEVFEGLKLIGASGLRGGFPRLFNYARSDLARVEQSIREADARLDVQIAKLNAAMSDGSTKSKLTEKIEASNAEEHSKNTPASTTYEEGKGEETEGTVQLEGDAFTFGYLSKSVHLDVLGSILVPLELAYGKSSANGGFSGEENESNSVEDPRKVMKLEEEILETGDVPMMDDEE